MESNADNATACDRPVDGLDGVAVGDEFVGRTYSLPLLAVALGAFPVMASFERHSWALLVGGLGCNSLGAWMRWAATKLALAVQWLCRRDGERTASAREKEEL